jgi:hypothetical protein
VGYDPRARLDATLEKEGHARGLYTLNYDFSNSHHFWSAAGGQSLQQVRQSRKLTGIDRAGRFVVAREGYHRWRGPLRDPARAR